MSGKKRKNVAQEGERPTKKQQTTSHVTVKHHESGEIKPIIGSVTGIQFPKQIKFKSYGQKLKDGSSNIVLHSSEHPTIDYSAIEGDESNEKYLKHYIAVFDPASGQLDVTEAKKLHIRSSVRVIQTAPDDEGANVAPVTNYTSRAALTEAFGTKKSKKAVQSIAENRLLAQGNEEPDNPISAALMSGLDEDDLNIEAGADAATIAAIANKPIPTPNLHTNEIAQVYALSTLVGPAPDHQTLAVMPINIWIARISSKKEIKTRSRFVASRVGYLTKHLINSPEASDATLKQNLQLLRYIQILIEIHNHVRNAHRKKSVPPANKWPENVFSDNTPMSIIPGILSKFFKGDRLPTTQAMTLLRTTILALTLHIPPPSLQWGQGLLASEPTDIALDMAIELAEVKKLYRELGCKVEPATETELSRWGLERLSGNNKKNKADAGTGTTITSAGKPSFAKLRLPLAFPKVSRGKPQGRR